MFKTLVLQEGPLPAPLIYSSPALREREGVADVFFVGGGGQRRRVVCDGWAGRFRYDWAIALGYKPARILLVLLLLILLLLLLLLSFMLLFVFLFLMICV